MPVDTLDILRDEPKKTHISEESVSEELEELVKDKRGRIVGLEKIGFFPPEVDPLKHFLKHPETFYLTER